MPEATTYEVRTYQLDTGDGAPIDVETVTADQLPVLVDLSAHDLGCAPGTRYRVDTVAIASDRSETVVASMEDVAN